MIKVYRLDRKGDRVLLTTFTTDRSDAAKDYAEKRARPTGEDNIIIDSKGVENFIVGDRSETLF